MLSQKLFELGIDKSIIAQTISSIVEIGSRHDLFSIKIETYLQYINNFEHIFRRKFEIIFYFFLEKSSPRIPSFNNDASTLPFPLLFSLLQQVHQQMVGQKKKEEWKEERQ